MLKGISDINKEERSKSETILSSLKFNPEFFKALIQIMEDENAPNYFRIQAIVTLKNILKQELNVNRSRFKFLDQENPEIKNIVEYLKVSLIEVLTSCPSIHNYRKNIKEVFKLIGDKYFPEDWNSFIFLVERMFKLSIQEVETNLTLIISILTFFFSILKYHNSKRIPSTRMKYLKHKAFFNQLILNFYEIVNVYLMNELPKCTNEVFLYDFLTLVRILDKTLLLMVESGFSINELCSDDLIIKMFTIGIDKTCYLVEQVIVISRAHGKQSKIAEFTSTNLNKNLIYLSKILCNQTAQILFYSGLEKYIQILLFVINEHKSFEFETLKICIFSLFKLITTDFMKDPKNNFMSNRSQSSYSAQKDNLGYLTPEKKSSSNLFSSNHQNMHSSSGLNLISPIKFKNYDREVKIASEIFTRNFNQTTVFSVFNSLVNDIPMSYSINSEKNEASDLENAYDREEDHTIDCYDTNNISWYSIFKNCIESMMINFRDILIDYSKTNLFETLSKAISGNNFDILSQKGFSYISSVSLVINIFPTLYQTKVINQTQIIDYTKYFEMLELLVRQHGQYVSIYISTINKWADVLISYSTIHIYINNISILLNSLQDQSLLIEGCLSLGSIISKIDNFFSDNKKIQVFNLTINSEELSGQIKQSINWSEILIVTTKIFFEVLLSRSHSAEVQMTFIKLLTMLIEKCHFQCDGSILDIINRSNLKEIIMLKNELIQSALNDMFKALLFSFPSSEVIIELTLNFIEFMLGQIVDSCNLNMMLFFVKVIELDFNSLGTGQILKKTSSLLISLIFKYTSNYSNSIIFLIFEEIVMANTLGAEDLVNVLTACTEKFINVQILASSIVNQLHSINSSISNDGHRYSFNTNTEINLINSDMLEYKTSLLNSIYAFLVISNNVRVYFSFITEGIFSNLLYSAFSDIQLKPELINSQYNTALVGFVNRICCVDFEFFSVNFSRFVQEKEVNMLEFLQNWFSKMENTLSSEIRRINVITVCILLSSLQVELFFSLRSEILGICLRLVHAELMRKIMNNSVNSHPGIDDVLEDNRLDQRKSIKSLLIGRSLKKRQLHKSDYLQKIDIHDLFVNKFKEALERSGQSFDSFCSSPQVNSGLKAKLSEVLGFSSPIDDS